MHYSIPLVSAGSAQASFYHFEIDPGYVFFAGSRYATLDPHTTLPLVNMFASLGYCLMTGCADGIDRSFRQAMSVSDHSEACSVACAFQSRIADAYGLDAQKVVPHGLPARVALARRTVWMASHSSLLVLFPSLPIGRGSALALRTMLDFEHPAFVVTTVAPRGGADYDVLPSSLFGLLEGFWCIPRSLRLTNASPKALTA